MPRGHSMSALTSLAPVGHGCQPLVREPLCGISPGLGDHSCPPKRGSQIRVSQAPLVRSSWSRSKGDGKKSVKPRGLGRTRAAAREDGPARPQCGKRHLSLCLLWGVAGVMGAVSPEVGTAHPHSIGKSTSQSR